MILNASRITSSAIIPEATKCYPFRMEVNHNHHLRISISIPCALTMLFFYTFEKIQTRPFHIMLIIDSRAAVTMPPLTFHSRMKGMFVFTAILLTYQWTFSQTLPPKQAYPLNVKQIHSGHSLTDPLFFPHWPGQFVNLIGVVNGLPAWQLFDQMVGKSTTPGSSMKHRWDNPPGFGAPDARHDIQDWELLCITERVPLYYDGGSTQQWYLDGLAEQRNTLSLFVNHAWMQGNNGNGTPTLLWTTWTSVDNSNGPFRAMLDTLGKEWETMQDFANENRPPDAPHVYLIPGHKMMARLYDDIQAGIVPDISHINQFFGDNIHTNELGAYAISMIHYACIFNKNPVGLPHDLLPDAPGGTPKPSPALAAYLQEMVWDIVTQYPRTGVTDSLSSTNPPERKTQPFLLYPNPTNDYINIQADLDVLSNFPAYRITNYAGDCIHTGKTFPVEVSHFPAGIYVLSIGEQYLKFVKE